MRRFSVFAALVAGLLLVLLPSATAGNGPKDQVVDVQLLAFNDFHGALEPPTGSGANVQTGYTVDPATGKDVAVNTVAGGMEYFATHVAQLRDGHPHTLVVSAGDNIGASPLLSAMFHDEPTIEALNLIGTRFSAVGNHEFDEGPAELLRMQNGGCHPVDGCQDQTPFGGAEFKYLTSNVTWADTGKTLFPPYFVATVTGVKVAFVAATLQDAPSIVTAAGVAGLDFLPEVAQVNAAVTKLKAEGVHTFVVLLHQGGAQGKPYSNGHFAQINGCDHLSSGFASMVEALDSDVDVVVSGHTHNAYRCTVDGKTVTAALSGGRLITSIDLKIASASDEVTSSSATNVMVTRDVPKDAAITDLIAHYNTYGAPIANAVVGSITGDLKRGPANTESALGDVIADAQRYAMQSQGAIAALTNPGGIRSDITYNGTGAPTPDPVTYGELFAVQPFNNYMVVKDMIGADLYKALEQQFSGANAGTDPMNEKMLQVSAGFTYEYDSSALPGSRIVPGSLYINGLHVENLSTYRIAMNNFLAGGGDNFPALAGGTNAVSGMLDIEAAVKYFTDKSPVAPGPMNRVVKIG